MLVAIAGTLACSRGAAPRVRKIARNIADEGLRIDEDSPNNVSLGRFVVGFCRRADGAARRVIPAKAGILL